MNGDPAARLANTLNVSFPGLDAESLLINLDLAGICASSGSACMVGSIMPSHVLLAMGVAPELARATVRFSLGKETTEDEITAAIERIAGILARLHAVEV
jgi:cysteine desulfurase